MHCDTVSGRDGSANEKQRGHLAIRRSCANKNLTRLACYQCLGASKKLLEDVSGEDRAAIQYAVKETAKLIDLKLRPESTSAIRGAAYQRECAHLQK